MSNRKQTSVDWLIKEISRDRVGRAIITTFYQEFEQAKQLNRQEIMDAWNDGEAYMDSGKNGNEYYNDTYETNN